MKANRELNSIEYGKQKGSFDAVVTRLASKSDTLAAKFLVERLRAPRELRTNALRFVLNDYVKIAKELDLTDEVMYRLNWYPVFSEVQLVLFWNQLVERNSERFSERLEFFRFKKAFYSLLLLNADKVGFLDSELEEMLKLPETPKSDFNAFMENANDAFYDFEYNLDAMSYEDIRNKLKRCSTVADIRQIAEKYDIDVPKRLRKDEFVELVVEGLKRQGKYTVGQEEDLAKMSAITLQRFAKLNNIKASTEMKKEDTIDYMMNHIEASDRVVQKPRMALELLPELEEFIFMKSYLREVMIRDEYADEEEVQAEPVKEEPAPAPVVEEKQPEPEPEPVVEEVKEVHEVEEVPVDDKSIRRIIELLNERSKTDLVTQLLDDSRYQTVMKMYEERIKYLEDLIEKMRTTPVPINITVGYPNGAPLVGNNVVEDEEEDLDNEEITPIVLDPQFDTLQDAEKKDAVAVLMKDATEPVVVEDNLPDAPITKKEKKEALRKKKAEKARDENDIAQAKRRKRRRVKRIIWTIVLIILFIFIALCVWGALVDTGVLSLDKPWVANVDKVVSYTYIFKPGVGVRAGILYLINMVKGWFGK